MPLLPSNIDFLSDDDKIALMRTVADEMSATFITISKEIQRGTLNSRQTASLHRVIHIIQTTTQTRQRSLERKLARYQRRARRWRGHRRWIRRQFAEVVQRSERLHQVWKKRVTALEEANKN